MNRYVGFSILLSCVVIAVTLWQNDWIWVFVASMGIVIMVSPIIITHDIEASYGRSLMALVPIPLIAYLVLFTINMYLTLDAFYETSVAIMAFASMLYGMMVAIYLNINKETVLSRRWIIIYSLIFACSLSMLYMLFTVIWMSTTGYPLYNGDFENTMDNDESNRMLMLPIAVTTVVTVFYVVILNTYFKRVDRKVMSEYAIGGSRDEKN
ncbi:MAG: hypothetical protein WCR24_02665 [Candidatus Methanomethylophilaceae archaeon]